MTDFLPTMALPVDAKPACDGQWELFDSTDRADHRKAATLCAECPVRVDCKDIVTSQRDTATGRLAVEGTWAGQLYGDTKRIARSRNSRELQPCGTRAAYARHIRAGERPCDPCRAANAERQREGYQKEDAA